MHRTSNFGLLKPEGQEQYNIEDFNSNMDAIDRRMYMNMQAIQSAESHIANNNNPHSVTKDQIGLGRVDNTSDSEKPISIQQQAALDRKQDILEYDTVPTENSTKMVKSGGIFNYIKNVFNTFVGATTSGAGQGGLVPAPTSGSANRFLRSDGTWATVTKSNVGLGSVGNYKAVSTGAQTLNTTEQTNARNNIGAGTSNFSGNFSDLTNVPTWMQGTSKPSYSAHEVGAYSQSEVNELLTNVTDSLTYDEVPTEGSNKLVKSGGIFNAMKSIATYLKNFIPASSTEAGKAGLVPAPPISDKTLYLSSSGAWSDPSTENAEVFSVGKAGIVPAPTSMDSNKFLKADGTWGTPSGQGGTSVVTDPGLARKHYALKENTEQSFESVVNPTFVITIAANSKGERTWTISKSEKFQNSSFTLRGDTIYGAKVINTLDDEPYSYYTFISGVDGENIKLGTSYSDSQIESHVNIESLSSMMMQISSVMIDFYDANVLGGQS